MPTIVTLQTTGVEDTQIKDNLPTTNYSTQDGIGMGGLPEIYRILIKFDLSSIPVGVTINSAIMSLNFKQDLTTNARVASVYRIKQAVVFSQTTWNIYSTGNNWVIAGCGDTTSDREATDISDGPTVSAAPTIGTWLDFTLTPSKIQEMITGGSFTNNGFLVKVATEVDDLVLYESTEFATAGSRPKLVVTYTTPADIANIFVPQSSVSVGKQYKMVGY